MKMREQNADVMFLSDLSTPEWMSEGNKVVMFGLEEYTLFVSGMVGIVLSSYFVKLWQNSGSVTRTAGNKRWIGLTTCQRRAEGVRTGRDTSTWNMEPSCCRS